MEERERVASEVPPLTLASVVYPQKLVPPLMVAPEETVYDEPCESFGEETTRV